MGAIMPAGFISYADDFTYQITDEAESMVFLGRTDAHWDKTSDEIVAIDNEGVSYRFGRISKAIIPEHGAGLMIFNGDGKIMFSSLVRPMATVFAVSLSKEDSDIAKNLPTGRRYAVAIFGQGRQSWAVNIRHYPGNPESGYDDVWVYDEQARFRDVTIDGNTVRTQIVERQINSGLEDISAPGILSTGTMFLQAIVVDVTGL